ncbi:hypothetical protein F4818DRAFT_418445, partial [Hypoxylon cercidicola]
MEVVGVVAAIPELVKLTKNTAILIRDISNTRKALSKITDGLDLQLQALTEALDLINARSDPKLLSSNHRQKLSELVQQLREQLGSLNHVLSSARSDSKLKRMWMVVRGLKKQLKDDVQKLETSITILKLHLLECNLTLCENAAAATRLAKKSEVRRLLNPSEHEFIRAKLDGTLGWLPSHPVLAPWLPTFVPPNRTASPLSRLLVIHGTKGCGKSVLAGSLADHVRSTGSPCAFFSFFHGIERQRKSRSMFSTILWQVLNFEGFTDEILGQTYESIINSESLTTPPLLRAIEGIVTALKEPFYIIIDGIDESDDDWNDDDGPLKIFKGWLRQYPLLRVLLVGRQSALHSAVGQLGPGNIIELSEEITKDDISQFIAHKLHGSPNLAAMPNGLRVKVQETLREKSAGMFLWVELVFKELRHCYSPHSVQECLQDLPGDLEAEYVRLFTKLIRQLHGQPGKPSHQTIVTRTLLALIVGALEPLSINDLRYALATSHCRDQGWEDHLISEDAVFHFLGDFIICIGNNVHLCHSSLEEFLLRPQEEWTGNQKEIDFFRLDYLECHQLIGCACIKYVTNIDFGYPLTDDSYQALTDKPFLLYATKTGPLHLIDLCAQQDTLLTNIELLKVCITGPNFGGFIEFIALASLDRNEFIEDYISSLMVAPQWPETGMFELWGMLNERVAAEDAYRLNKFGPDDPRTRSWSQVLSVIRNLAFASSFSTSEETQNNQTPAPGLDLDVKGEWEQDELEQPHKYQQQSSGPTKVALTVRPSSSSTSRSGQTLRQPSRIDHRVGISSIKVVNAAVHSNIQEILPAQALRQALQIWVDPNEAFRKMKRAFVARLPFPIHMFYALHIVQFRDDELFASLLDLAMQRTEGQQTIYRIWALMVYAHQCDHEEGLRHFSEAYKVLSRLEDSPITRFIIYGNVRSQIPALNSLHKKTEITRLVDDLLDQSVTPNSKNSRHRRQYFFHSLVYRTGMWREYEIESLQEIAATLYRRDLLKDAQRVYEHLVVCAKARYGPHHPSVLHYQLHCGEILLEDSDPWKAEECFRKIIEEHSTHGSARQSFEFRLFRLNLAVAAFRQERFIAASMILREILQELVPQEKGTIKEIPWEEELCVMQARVLLLEVLGRSAILDPDQSLRKHLLKRCLAHLDWTSFMDIRALTAKDVVSRCCTASEEVYGANHEMTWMLENYIPRGDGLGERYLYECECEVGKQNVDIEPTFKDDTSVWNSSDSSGLLHTLDDTSAEGDLSFESDSCVDDYDESDLEEETTPLAVASLTEHCWNPNISRIRPVLDDLDGFCQISL